MITSVDTNVLLDVFVSSALHHSQSQEWLIGADGGVGAAVVEDIGVEGVLKPNYPLRLPD